MIDHIYKFRTFNTNNLTALSNCHLWFSELEKLNDPFEGQYYLNDDISDNDIQILTETAIQHCKYVDPDSEEFYNLLDEIGVSPNDEKLMLKLGIAYADNKLSSLISILQNSKFISFSAKTIECDPLYENLLWSHYSDGLRGYCLVFDNKKLKEYFYSSIEEAIRPIQVSYQKTPNVLSLSDFINSESFEDKLDRSYIQKVTEVVATKSVSWSYENELRFITLGENNIYPYSPECLHEIVLGEKMPTDKMNLLKEIIKSIKPDISIKYASIEKNTYSIKISDNLK